MNELGTSTQGHHAVGTVRIDQYLRDNRHHGLLWLRTCRPADGGGQLLLGRRMISTADGVNPYHSILQPTDELSDGPRSEDGGVILELSPESRPITETNTLSFLAYPVSGPPAVRDMILQASQNDVAILLTPGREGLTSLLRRNTCLVSDAGFRRVVLLITEMENLDNAREVFAAVEADFHAFAKQAGIGAVTVIPVSTSMGDNILHSTTAMTWYQGPALVDYLATVEPNFNGLQSAPFRMLVEHVEARDGNQQACSGPVVGGTARTGDRVRIQPLGREASIGHIMSGTGAPDQAVAGQTVTLMLDHVTGIASGAVVSTINAPAEVADQFEARVVWLHEQPLYPGRKYLIKVGSNTVGAVVTDIKYEVNVDNLDHLAANKLEVNGIAVCNLALDRPLPFAPYGENRDLGGFLLIDRLSGDTMGVGMLNFALRRAHNIHLQHVDVDKSARLAHKGHRPCVLWFTGLSGSGKSTVANLVERRLHALGVHTYLLDGDNVRHGLNRDLGFTDADRVENIRRVAEVSKLMVDAGLIVITAFISPFRAERRMARQLLEEGEFLEVFTDTPLEVAEQRDPKGLYKKARRGALKNFTGIDSPYEQPESPEIRLQTHIMTPQDAAEMVIEQLKKTGILNLDH